MEFQLRSLPWRALARAVALAYGLSFVSGLFLLVNDITPQTDQALYPLLALLSGGIGVAVALRVLGTSRPSYVAILGIALWLLNLSSVLLGAQTLVSWFDSGVSIATTVILGRLLVGNSLAARPEPLHHAM